MTFAELKARIVSTLYLPLWVRSGITTVNPTVIQPNIEPAPPGTPKWCPYTRSVSVLLKDDGTQPVTSKVAKNRNVYLKKNAEGVVELVGSSLEAAYCVQDRCMMWDAAHSTCGLRNPLLHVQDAVVEAQALHKVMYPDQYPTTDGTGDAP